MSDPTIEDQSQKETPNEKEIPPNETPKETPAPIKEKKEKVYILFRVMNKIYCLNKEDIPETGMLRTIYNDNEKEETICEVKEEFEPCLVNFVFNCIRKEKIINYNKDTVGMYNYIQLIKISRFFQIDEKIIMDSIELHWIYRYRFIANGTYNVNIFAGFVETGPVLSFILNDKSYIIKDFEICFRWFVTEKDKKYQAIRFELGKKEFLIIKFDDKNYKLYSDKKIDLQAMARSVTYDSIKIDFTIE